MKTFPKEAVAKARILVVGDIMLDRYWFGEVERISPEAPVPVFVPTYQEERDGMAGNVFNNLETLGCDVNYLFGETSKKTRLIDQRSRQQIARIDNDVQSEPIRFETAIPTYDAIVISDYAKGTVDYTLIQDILQEVTCPVFIDTKLTELDRMQGAWVKVNELEYSKLKSECAGLIVTRGAEGADVMHPHSIHCSAPAVEVADVTGAGDTFLAALVYQYLVTQNIKLAVEFATRAASITVQHVGVYAPTLEEIQ